MMKKTWTKKVCAALLAVVLGMGTAMPAPAAASEEAIVVLYTNDVHCTSDEGMTYAKVAAYKESMEEAVGADNVTLVDTGDAIQGGILGTLSDGGWLVDIMNQVGVDLAVPGNHEFDFGMDTFLDIANHQAAYQYLSCNFLDKNGAPVLTPYVMKDYGDLDVAYVGVTTPETLYKSTPAYFQDEAGHFIYSFCQDESGEALYTCVQQSVDAARAEGADVVVALAHLGEDPGSAPWRSTDVIAHTTGIDVVLDGHSHTTQPQALVENADGEDVVLSQTGTKGENLGALTIEANGDVSTALVPVADIAAEGAAYEETAAFVQDIQDKYRAMSEEKVAESAVTLTVNDPQTGERAVRSAETNLGDFCADAYRTMMGADIGLVNGGGIRENIAAGDVTYGDVIAVHPFGNMLCLVEVRGQQILDALEMGSRLVGEGESGGFLQVSGLTYHIDPSVPSTVKVDDTGAFVEVSGSRRVSDVMVQNGESGQWQALDPNKTYTVASHNYMLKQGGDGFSMFGPENIKVLKDETMVDNEALIDYINGHLQGVIGEAYSDPRGQGRITIGAQAESPYPDVKANAWYSDAIRFVSDEKLMGTTDGVHFSPAQPVSLASVYAVLYRLEGAPAVDHKTVTDTAGHWYDNPVNWAASVGLYEGTTFGSDRPVRRADVAQLVAENAARKGVDVPADDGTLAKAPDADDIPADRMDGVRFCFYTGLMTGDAQGALHPLDDLTRAEFAQILADYDHLLSEAAAAA